MRMLRRALVVLFFFGLTAHLSDVWGQYVRPSRTAHFFPDLEEQQEEMVEEEAVEIEDPYADVEEGGVDIRANRLEYEAERKVLIGIGSVVIWQGGDRLYADYVEFHTETQEAFARGNVWFQGEDRNWRGEEITYNFKTRQGDFGEFLAAREPWFVSAEQSERISEDEFLLKRATVTTCEGDSPEFVIRAKQARVDVDGPTVRAKHAVTYLYGVPIFYTPYFKRNLSEPTNIELVPGYSSKMGAFILFGYKYPVAPHVRATTRLDYRSRRGVGVGQDFKWKVPDNSVRGNFRSYYTSDDKPIQGDRQKEERPGLVDGDRYRVGLSHVQMFTPRDYLILEGDYLSDPFVLEDFFEDEFRRKIQPENRASLTHRGDNFTAGLLFNVRLNDFYGNVNRLPELSLDISRQPILDSPFYYESQSTASYLERVFAEGTVREDYDAFRVDSRHRIFYPTKHFGFLNIIPDVGYRATYYSNTRSSRTVTEEVPILGEPAEEGGEPPVIGFTNEVTTVESEEGADLRNIYEFGLETSFKAFKVIHEEPIYLGEGLRHVVEPYARYSIVPRPNLEPSDLPQFDAVDALDKEHQIRFGVRNKLQTKRGNRVHDMIDLNIFTIYYIEPEEEQNDFDDLFFDARLRLARWLRIDFEGGYDGYENEVSFFNTQIAAIAPDLSSVALEYRYTREQRHLAMSEIVLFPEDRWSYSGYWRYDIDESELEEQIYMVQRRFNCTLLGVGLRSRLEGDGDTEWRVWAQVSLLAFPESELRLGR